MPKKQKTIDFSKIDPNEPLTTKDKKLLKLRDNASAIINNTIHECFGDCEYCEFLAYERRESQQSSMRNGIIPANIVKQLKMSKVNK